MELIQFQIYLCLGCYDNEICNEKIACVPYTDEKPRIERYDIESSPTYIYHLCAFSLPEDFKMDITPTKREPGKFLVQLARLQSIMVKKGCYKVSLIQYLNFSKN